MNKLNIFSAGICLIGLGIAFPAYATDGYYLTGANARATGMGGVGIALPQGPEAATINPAGATFVDNGFEIGAQLFILNTRTTDLFRSEEHTSELQSLMRISYAVFCLKKKKIIYIKNTITKT